MGRGLTSPIAELLEGRQRVLPELLGLFRLALLQEGDGHGLQGVRLAPPVLDLARQGQRRLRRLEGFPRRLLEQLDIGEHLEGGDLDLLLAKLLGGRARSLGGPLRVVDGAVLDVRRGQGQVCPHLQFLVPELSCDRERVAGALEGGVHAILSEARPRKNQQSGHLHLLVVDSSEAIERRGQGLHGVVGLVLHEVDLRGGKVHAALAPLVPGLLEPRQLGRGLLHGLLRHVLQPICGAHQPQAVLLPRLVASAPEKLQRLGAALQRLVAILVLGRILGEGEERRGLPDLRVSALVLGQGAVM
mmetsp:Transcript_127239/g.368394  ORF Transcript_127239/g.368394 Transcript_127239/m.368394 type:complete len:302 (+) Transcript_127239:1563-2468(+)